MGEEGTKALPLDLVLWIANYCSQPELSSLASLNRSCHLALVSILYRRISLTRVQNILSFCDAINTGQPQLGSYPKSIHIEPARAPVSDLKSLSKPIRQMLSLVPSLLDLELLVPDYVMYDILEPSFDHSFMLTRLSVRVSPGLGFSEFLKRQRHIEEITCQEFVVSDPESRYLYLDALSDPGVLPLLKRADGFFAFFASLASNRPLSAVYVREIRWPDLLVEVADALSRTSVPLTCLGADLAVRRLNFERDIDLALVALGRLRGSLEDVSLRLLCGVPGTVMAETISGCELLDSSNTPSHGLEKIRESLAPFTALRNFELNSSLGKGLPSRLRLTVPELSQFELWQKSCPTLHRVSIFEVVLSAE